LQARDFSSEHMEKSSKIIEQLHLNKNIKIRKKRKFKDYADQSNHITKNKGKNRQLAR